MRLVLTVLCGIGALGSWTMYSFFTHNIHDALLAIWLTQLFTAGSIMEAIEREGRKREARG